MADQKITDLTADSAPTSDDLVVVVNDPGGTPVNRKVTLTNLTKGLAEASASVKGIVTISNQSFAGSKTFTEDIIGQNDWRFQIGATSGNVMYMTLSNRALRFANNMVQTWSDTDDSVGGGGAAVDTGLARNSAGVLEVNNQNKGTFRDILVRGLRSNAVAFSSAIGSPAEGTLQAFTDSTTSTPGATITGGGSNHVLGYYNGTNWKVVV